MTRDWPPLQIDAEREHRQWPDRPLSDRVYEMYTATDNHDYRCMRIWLQMKKPGAKDGFWAYTENMAIHADRWKPTPKGGA